MSPRDEHRWLLTRRALLGRAAHGVGGIALASLLGRDAVGETTNTAGTDAATHAGLHFPARARSVICIHLIGAPSQLDLFDDKPVLREHDGQPCPDHLLAGQRFAFLRGHPRLLGSPFRFSRSVGGGVEMSELLPNLLGVADEIAVVKTLHTDLFNHAPAQLFVHTGSGLFGRPSMGAWVTYGLGRLCDDLPSYVVINHGATAGGGNALWGPGFLPSVYQGVEFRSDGDPVLFLSNPAGVAVSDRRRALDTLEALNARRADDVGDPEIRTRIEQYEMAFRMQASVPDLMDISAEPAHVHALYGSDRDKPSFANNCLLARRLVERGVRFVQLFDDGWDHHGSIAKSLPKKCQQVDRPIAGLIADLKQRGLLDDTLIVWTSEFGRTPMLQGETGDGGTHSAPGRDHHKDAFTGWVAGGGVRGGVTIGRTDDLGYHAVEDQHSVHDLHATLLYLLGIDHERLTHRFGGRRFRLTDVSGEVIGGMLG
ncbi:MAG: DUF1501 domain-containing protein [Planctomycetales bacterium]|nr:DUF1501 domain-containing protein [Planctomycetales bacterium]